MQYENNKGLGTGASISKTILHTISKHNMGRLHMLEHLFVRLILFTNEPAQDFDNYCISDQRILRAIHFPYKYTKL